MPPLPKKKELLRPLGRDKDLSKSANKRALTVPQPAIANRAWHCSNEMHGGVNNTFLACCMSCLKIYLPACQFLCIVEVHKAQQIQSDRKWGCWSTNYAIFFQQGSTNYPNAVAGRGWSVCFVLTELQGLKPPL